MMVVGGFFCAQPVDFMTLIGDNVYIEQRGVDGEGG
jgi:hypothetical protein